jgi:3-oxoadipate enol-lactonase
MRIENHGTGIDYQTSGPRTGLPVVLIHGFPFSREMWQPQIEALKKNYYLITYDVRGHGSSDTGDGQYTVELFVDDLITLLDHLKLSRVVLGGFSMGGYIALRAVERHPERFRALILCDTKSEPDNNEGKIRRAVQVKAVKQFGTKQFAENFLRTVFHEKSFATRPEAVELIREIIGNNKPAGVAGTLIALAARTDTTSSLFTIAIPTLILVGQHDALTPVSAASAMKAKIPGAELRTIPHAAHMSNLENPDEFNEALLEFLKKIRLKGTASQGNQ